MREFFAENSLIDLPMGYCQTLIRAALLCIQSKFRSLQKNPDYLSPKKDPRNASAVSDAPPPGLPNQPATHYGARPIQLFEGSRPVGRHLCKFNGVSVMRKTRGIGGGADQSTGRSASIGVCVRKFQARSLVGDNESAPRLQVMGSTERARSEWEFHGAAPMRKGGERSWSWAAVSLSMTTMGPPHWGQSQSGFDCLASAAVGLDCDGCSASSSR